MFSALWWVLVASLVAFLCKNWQFFAQTWDYVRSNPAFPLLKGNDAPPYSIGLLDSIFHSLLRVTAGSTIGFASGTVLGLSLSQMPVLGHRVHALLLLLAPLTPIVWLPVLLARFGTSNTTSVLIVASASVFISAVVVFHLATHPKQAHVDLIRLMGGSRISMLRYVVVPSLIPVLLLLFRLTLLGGWAALMASEMAGVESGLGAMLSMGRSLGNSHLIFVATVLTATIAFAVDRLLTYAAVCVVSRRYGSWLFTEGF